MNRRNDLVAMLSFNTAMMHRDHPDLKIRFTKPEIDKVNNDKRYELQGSWILIEV